MPAKQGILTFYAIIHFADLYHLNRSSNYSRTARGAPAHTADVFVLCGDVDNNEFSGYHGK